MAAFFASDRQALPGVAKFFKARAGLGVEGRKSASMDGRVHWVLRPTPAGLPASLPQAHAARAKLDAVQFVDYQNMCGAGRGPGGPSGGGPLGGDED